MRNQRLGLACALLLASAPITARAADAPPPADDHAVLFEIAGKVDPTALRATIQTLVGFGTRHTASDTASPTRGIGAARRWAASRMGEISKACGGCLQVDTPDDMVTGDRLKGPTRIVDVLGIQRGTSDPDRVVIISGHLDSRVSDVMNTTADAPGADDDGSGVAAVLEAARVLSQYKFPATIVYAVLSGEEQDLYGGRLLAKTALARNWKVEAQLNNDIVGNSRGQSGAIDNTHVRIFAEGTKADESPADAARRFRNGGELDSPARNLARYMQTLSDRYLNDFSVRMIYRTDRYGRGSDQMPMLQAGFPAVRVTEAQEDYTHEHQDLRTENGVVYGDRIEGVDFPYLAQVTRVNILTLASLAWAPAAPSGVKVAGAVTPDTTLSWDAVPAAAGYRVWWRDTTAPQWRFSRWAGPATSLKLAGVNIDDWTFGVSAVGADGFASPVVFPGPAGDFARTPAAASAGR
jgi:Zn-dependent M28 family amino/carboxypeptidase